jgi:ABC-type transport system substrate-binding protein
VKNDFIDNHPALEAVGMMAQNRSFTVLALALLVASCGNAGPEGARLSVTVVGDAAGPDSLSRRLEAEATQPTLIAHDSAGQAVAGLATSWRFVDDGRSLILRLRPVKWSDGKLLTSSEVVSAFRRAAVRREPAMVFSGLAGAPAIAAGSASPSRLGVLAPISRVVELRLEAASPLLLGWLAQPGMTIDRIGKSPATLAAYSATGPAEKRQLKRRTMVAAPDSRPAEIIISTTADSAAAVTAFARGDTDIVIGEGLAGLGDARTGARPDALRIDPLWGIYGYVANSLRGPLADPRVRRALTMAIDRPVLTARFGIAAIAPVEGLLPPSLETIDAVVASAGTAGTETNWRNLNIDARLVEAERLLAAAGWNRAHPLRLVLLLPPGRDHRIIAETVANEWASIGVGLAVSEVDVGDIDRRVGRGEFDLAVTEASLPVGDAAAFLARWRCGAGPHCNPAADALLNEAMRAPPTARGALLAQAAATLAAGPPMIPLFTPIRWALVARRVDGWIPNPAASHPLARLTGDGRR